MVNYAFGAGDFKLGERVEILTTGQRGILISEVVHISGCNTYQVLLPNVFSEYFEGKMKTTNRDHLMLRKLDSNESIFDKEKELTDDNTFLPKGTDVNAEWIRAAIDDEKEFITEIDDAVGVEEITIKPGTEVWNKTNGKIMIVTHISRAIYSKELEYGSLHMVGDKEIMSYSGAYALIPLEDKIDIPPSSKYGSEFEDGRDNITKLARPHIDRYRSD